MFHPTQAMNTPHAIGSPGPEDMQRLRQEAYREQLLEEARKGSNITWERLMAIEERVKRQIQNLTQTEHDE